MNQQIFKTDLLLKKNSKNSGKSVQLFLKKMIKTDKNGTWKSENKWFEDPKKW